MGKNQSDSFSNYDSRGHDRAKFWNGIATAMAEQWGAELGEPGFTCAQQPQETPLFDHGAYAVAPDFKK